MTTEPTYLEMTIDHLGDEATEADLKEFRAACVAYQSRTGCQDAEATDFIFGNGDWLQPSENGADDEDRG